MKSLYSLVLMFFLAACSGNSVNDENCRFLLDVGVNIDINLSLPAYQILNSSGNSVYIPNVGNGGIILAKVGFDFFAWDATDPNHPQSECSLLVDLNDIKPNYGLSAKCQCEDENEYSFVNGLPLKNSELRCPLRNYRTQVSGNTLLIFN